MNQTDELDQPLSKGEFRDYVKTVSKIVATKEDLKEGLREMKEEIRTEIIGSNQKVMASNDQVIQKLDKILTELPATTHRLDEHDKEITKLKTRTAKLEVQVGIVN